MHITLDAVLGIGKFHDWSSDSKFLTAITSQVDIESTMYSDSVVLSDIKVCILENHTIGQPEKMMTYPVLECDESGSFLDLSYHDPAQSASTENSKPHFLSGLKTRPLSLVFRIYLNMSLTDSSWSLEGEFQYLAHCCVAMVIYGLNMKL